MKKHDNLRQVVFRIRMQEGNKTEVIFDEPFHLGSTN